jgi:hypothetical protein
VLERKEGEVRETRHVVLRRVDAEHAALVAGSVALGFGDANARLRADGNSELGVPHETLAGSPE